jgi:hypothetical protein
MQAFHLLGGAVLIVWSWTALATIAIAVSSCDRRVVVSESVVFDDGRTEQWVACPERVIKRTSREGDWLGWHSPRPVSPPERWERFPELGELRTCEFDESDWIIYRRENSEYSFGSRTVAKCGERSVVFSERIEMTRLGLVNRLTWRGVISDPVEPEEWRESAIVFSTEISELIATIVAIAASGEGLDCHAYCQWLRPTLKKWLLESVTDYFRHRLSGGEIEGFSWGAAEILHRLPAAGRGWGENALNVMMTAAPEIRSENHGVLSREQVEAFLSGKVGLSRSEREHEWLPLMLSTEPAQRVVKEKYGSLDLFGHKMSIHFARLFGVDVAAGARTTILHRVSLPGELIETNGTRVKERTVEWSVGCSYAHPRFYELKAVALVSAKMPNGLLLIDESLDSMQTYVKCCDSDEKLLGLLERHRGRGVINRIEEYVDGLEQVDQALYRNGKRFLGLLK